VNSSFLITATPPWEAVRDHGALKERDLSRSVPLVRMARVGDTTATSGTDMVVVPMDDAEADRQEVPEEIGVYRNDADMPVDYAPALAVEHGSARVEERDGRAVILVRTPTGEYRACLLMPRDYTPDEWFEMHALLYQRQRLTRDTALPVPVHAGALQQAVAGGRDHGARKAALAARVRAKVDIVFDPDRRERVTVEVVLSKVRAMRLRLRADDPVFPQLASAPKHELPALVGEAMARMLPVRAYQAVLAGMSLVYRDGGVELEDGELSDAFRLAVMRTMGMPSRAASKAQRELVRGAMEFMVHAEVMVKPVGEKSPEYLPILVRTSYADDPDTKVRRARGLMLNPKLLPEMDEGRRWLVPEALFQVSDDADRDGVTRLLGFQLAHRLGMGTSGHERLELMLKRAGLWEWARAQSKTQRGSYVIDALRAGLDTLRALPHAGHAPADIVGGTVIVGTELATARVEYRDSPAWARSSG
jgi:hypothetical protein